MADKYCSTKFKCGEDLDAALDAALCAAHNKVCSEAAAERAEGAATRAESAANEAARIENELNPDSLREVISQKGDNLEFDDAEGLLYLTSGGERIGDGIKVATSGGGGGGGSSNNAVLTLKNTTGWIYKTISFGAACPITMEWSSIEDGLATGTGVLKVTVNGTVKHTAQVEQGEIPLDIGPWLSVGASAVKVGVTDTYGNSRTLSYNVTSIALNLASSFDPTVAYSGAIAYPYTPSGAAEKTVYFILDGEELGTATVTASGRQQTYNIPAQSHGSHTLEVYFTAVVDGETVESNRLYYDLICTEEGNATTIIAVPFRKTTAEQYDNIAIPYIVYNPYSLTAEVVLSANGQSVAELTVDRTQQNWTYRPDNYGDLELSIASGNAVKLIEMDITESSVQVEAETENLTLYLSSYGRSNHEDNPGKWEYGDVAAEFTGFNFTSDGWKLDDEGITALRVAGDARLNIPVHIFATDFRTTGKTIEIEFATRDVLNYDAPLITCFSGGRGLTITAQKALIKSEQSEISTQYKEDEHVRLAFVVEKKSEHRLLMIYINGILSGVVQYPDDDDFSQTDPVGISIGSSECTTDLYCIRVYDNNLTRYQVLDNWIADTQNAAERASRWNHNNVFDTYGSIVIDQLPADLPYLILKGDALPTYKGNELTIAGEYIDPVDNTKNFTFTDAKIDVQGTSSAGYERKNFKIKFSGGFVQNGTTKQTYLLGDGNVPTNTFTFKADVASSEGANNVELVKLYNDVSPHKVPPQETDKRVRQGIDGYPIVIFHDAGDGPVFIGKYNFNHDKGTSEVFGMDANDESWETKNNTSNRALWKDPDFSGTDWKNDFEARHPKDNEDVSNLAALAAWIASTDREAVSSEAEKAERLAKFKAEAGNWMDLDSTLFYYLFTELFLLADSRTKNAFPTKYNGEKWCWLPYDMDTALGINNEGKLAFGYELEDTDLVNGAQVYTGQKSVLWNNVRDAFPEELMEMYQDLRSNSGLSYEDTETRFREHQAKWPEAIFNEDAYYKYLAPLFEKNNGSYLGMLQGSKAEQRKWWLYNRFRYIDSKYNAGDALKDFITLRGYAKGDVEITPYADIYATVKYGSYLVQKRALRGDSYVLECPVDDLDDTEIYIYSASQLAEVGDLSDLMVGYAEFASGTKLNNLKLGDATEGYSNPNLTQLYLGNNVLLKTLDVRNCPNLGNTAADVNATPSVNLSGCTNIEHIYFDNTAITGLTLPNGGIIKTLHLPSTVTNLTIRNQTAITDFVLPSYENVSTLRLENVSTAIPVKEILSAVPANSRVRLIGFDWSFDSASDILALCDRLDTMRGLDEQGNNVDKAQVSGTVRVDSLTWDELTEIQSRYPDIKIVYQSLSLYIYFKNWDGTLIHTETCLQGGNVTDPVADGTIEAPTRTASEDTQYQYSGWNELPTNVQASCDVIAQYTEFYRVRYYNDGVLWTTQWVQEGTAAPTVANPTKESTAQYHFTFTGWDVDLTNILAPIDADAVYTETLRTFTVRFYNEGVLYHTVENVTYGSSVALPADPVKEGDWAFTGWKPEPVNIVSDTDCHAQYKATALYYSKIIERTISGSYTNETVTRVGSFALFQCNGLTEAKFYAATSVDDYAFYFSRNLTMVDFWAVSSIGDYVFNGCTNLAALILRSETMCTLSGRNSFHGTAIYNGNGYIYVPRALLSDDDATKDYRRASNWSNISARFRALEDYTVDGTTTGALDLTKI